MLKSLLVVALLSIPVLGYAEEPPAQKGDYHAATGDVKLDVSLDHLNTRADADLNGFISELSMIFDVPMGKIKHLIFDYKFTPADAYMALSVQNASGRSFHDVAHTYKDNRARGWRYAARELGIKPGSKIFHAFTEESDSVGHSHKDRGKNKQAPSQKTQL